MTDIANPGGTNLLAAHLKDRLMPQALMDKSQALVEGAVRLKLYRGNVPVIGRASLKASSG